MTCLLDRLDAKLRSLDTDPITQPEIIQNLLQLRLHVLCKLRVDAHRELDTYTEIFPGAQLGN